MNFHTLTDSSTLISQWNILGQTVLAISGDSFGQLLKKPENKKKRSFDEQRKAEPENDTQISWLQSRQEAQTQYDMAMALVALRRSTHGLAAQMLLESCGTMNYSSAIRLLSAAPPRP